MSLLKRCDIPFLLMTHTSEYSSSSQGALS